MTANLQKIHEIKTRFDSIKKEIKKVIIGQDDVVEEILIAMLCDANALLESYPGMGKTLMIKTIAQLMDLDFSRIQ
ncbi:MAG: AAA family ATPase, partial [Nanoarchaeota archaeon]|nr:AAA family ATPase [Nanoarchaeota archaeon]